MQTTSANGSRTSSEKRCRKRMPHRLSRCRRDRSFPLRRRRHRWCAASARSQRRRDTKGRGEIQPRPFSRPRPPSLSSLCSEAGRACNARSRRSAGLSPQTTSARAMRAWPRQCLGRLSQRKRATGRRDGRRRSMRYSMRRETRRPARAEAQSIAAATVPPDGHMHCTVGCPRLWPSPLVRLPVRTTRRAVSSPSDCRLRAGPA